VIRKNCETYQGRKERPKRRGTDEESLPPSKLVRKKRTVRVSVVVEERKKREIREGEDLEASTEGTIKAVLVGRKRQKGWEEVGEKGGKNEGVRKEPLG